MSTKRILSGAARGLVAGAVGTAVMTGYQLAVAKARGRPLSTPVPRTWAEAPAPAQVAKRILGRRVTKQHAPLLTNAMHWLYGISWGVGYGVVAAVVRPSAAAGAGALGGGLWGLSYAELVPLGIYKPPWEYPPAELALDLSYHVVYGAGVAAAFAAMDR